MSLLLLLQSAAGGGGGGGLTFTPLTGASLAASGSPLTTPASTTPASGFIAVVTVLASVPVTSVTDNKGNTYTKIAESAAVPGDSQKCALWACVGAVGGSGHTFTINSGDYSSLFPGYITGYDTTNPWDTNPLVSGTGTGNSLALNQPTLAQAKELLLFPILVNGAADNPGETPPAGFSTWFLQQNWSTWTGFASYLITSSATAATRTATGANWNSSTGFIVGVREAAAGPVNYDLSIDATSYTLTAAPVSFAATRALNFAATSYSLTPAAVTFTATRALSIDPAGYSLAAAPVTFDYAPTAKQLDLDPASYTLSVAPIALTASRALNFAPVGYTITAAPIALTASRALNFAATSYALTTAPVTLGYAPAAAKVLSIDPVGYTLSLAPVTLTYSGATPAQPSTGGGIDSITQGLARGRRKPMGDLFEREQEAEVAQIVPQPAMQLSPSTTKNDTNPALDALAISTLENLQLLQLEAVQAAQLAAQIDMEQQAALAQAMLQRRQDEELALLLLLS